VTRTSSLVVLLLASIPVGAVVAEEPATSGALAAYVQKADDSFRWVKRREGRIGDGSFVELTLTSQTWRNIVWKHQLFLFKPGQIADASQALLLIDGGTWNESLARPAGPDEQLPGQARTMALVASRMKSPVAVLRQVPQQPIFGRMVEDQIIAYTFEQYMRSGDEEWPLLLPMVKSAVRAMDATQQCARGEFSLEIKNFTLTGASKRGWTTWLTGAVDPRAAAIAPMVIDMLNMTPQMKHQLDTWGKYSEQIGDYTGRGLQKYLPTKPGQALQQIVDPFSYRRQLAQPKLIILGTNDRYWPLDALSLYWDELEGEKYVLYVPNNHHGLTDLPRVFGTINALHQRSIGRLQLPKLSGDMTTKGGKLLLRVRSDVRPKAVLAWTAASASRDFRDAKWTSRSAERSGDEYVYDLALPEVGYAAVFGEASFDAAGEPYYLSTQVKIAGKAGLLAPSTAGAR
jgi:PhoPQ-activated pathogenicity-related protein